MIESKSYDFWALRKDGSFYLLKTLYEDNRTENKIFFNTRIVRTAEMLMFLSRLYKHLGIPEQSKVSFSISHNGLEGRHLSATSNRMMFHTYGPSKENTVNSEIIVDLASLDESISTLVSDLLSPLFVIFDFFELEQKMYEEIVESFKAGRVT